MNHVLGYWSLVHPGATEATTGIEAITKWGPVMAEVAAHQNLTGGMVPRAPASAPFGGVFRVSATPRAPERFRSTPVRSKNVLIPETRPQQPRNQP